MNTVHRLRCCKLLLLAYYLDLVKDWIIFAILYKFIDKTTFFSFEAQLVFMLGVFLVFPEIVRGAVFAHHFKLVLDVSEYKFNHIAQDVLKVGKSNAHVTSDCILSSPSHS